MYDILPRGYMSYMLVQEVWRVEPELDIKWLVANALSLLIREAANVQVATQGSIHGLLELEYLINHAVDGLTNHWVQLLLEI